MVVLVMAYPRLALHELKVLLQMRPTCRGKQPGKIGFVENHESDSNALCTGAHIKLVQMLRDSRKVNLQLVVAAGRVELDVVAESVERAGRQRNRSSSLVHDRNHEIYGQT